MTAHRTERITVRLRPDERATLEQRARECGVPPSTFLRESALAAVPRARPGAIARETVHQLARVGNNLNQLARHSNAARRLRLAGRIERALARLEEILERLS
jgi:hypothetical protein